MLERRRALDLLLVITLAGCSVADRASESDVDLGQYGVKVIDEKQGSFRLVVEAIGSPPLLLREGVIRICGCELLVTREGKDEPVYAESHGEMEPEMLIDHTEFGRGILQITSFTSDPRQRNDVAVPFVRTCVTLGRNGDARIERDVVLPPEDADDATVDKWVEEILAKNRLPCDGDEERQQIGQVIDRDLGHLRNVAVSRPDAILARMQSLPRIAVDCECQHMKRAYVEEVTLLRDIQQERAKAGGR